MQEKTILRGYLMRGRVYRAAEPQVPPPVGMKKLEKWMGKGDLEIYSWE